MAFFDFENNDDVYSNARIQKIADEYFTKILKTKHASKDIYDLYWTTFFEECKGKVGIKESVEFENVTGVEVFFSDIHEQSRLKKTFPEKRDSVLSRIIQVLNSTQTHQKVLQSMTTLRKIISSSVIVLEMV
ncbi:hypothetical protein [Leuconostoc gasicomitatum]|uniref:hypothetical protein n=1 Tax=Leuconostoc gasicomitatum TaxID=115778 RepID=UPI001CC5D41E|nr:hypothetical protein [Leuconostoc gasicomitatum]